MQAGYQLHKETPSIEDYRRLRVLSGMSPKSLEAATAGLPNTLFAAVIREDGKAVGMGRIIGDGGLFFQVVDIAVDPEHQGKGLGKAIVSTLVEHLHKIAQPGAYISLIADGEARHLYAQYGFKPTAPASIGMYLHIS